MQKELFSITEVVEATGLSRATVYRQIESGRLRSIKIGSCRRISRRALTNFIERLERDSRTEWVERAQ